MKNLVLLWGWIVLLPILAPIIAVPILILLGRAVSSLSARVNTALVFLLICLLLGGIALGNLRYGPDLFFQFLKTSGEGITAKVTNVRRVNSLSGDSTTQVDLLYTSPTVGETTVTLSLAPNRILPETDGLDLPPAIGDTMKIYVFPKAESVLMVDSDPTKSSYGAKLQCAVLQRRFNRAQLRVKSSEFPTADIREAHVQSIKDLLNTDCPNLEQRNHLRGLLSTQR